MNPLEISCQEHSPIDNFLTRYNIWRDYENFYHGRFHVPVVRGSTGISVFHYEDIAQINQQQSSLVIIDAVTEGWHSERYFRQYKPGPHYVIFSDGWWNQNVKQLPFEYSLINYKFWIFDTVENFLSPTHFSYLVDRCYDFYVKKSVQFVSTIGRKKKHRDFLVEQIINHIPDDQFILRYQGNDHGVSVSNDFTRYLNVFDSVKPLLPKYWYSLSSTLPIDLYNQAKLNLVVETEIEGQDEFFITEKTVKTLLTGMPFVMAATTGFLRHLRSLGFRTYSDLWDESYDLEPDWRKRIVLLVDLLKDLEKFDWAGNQAQLISIGNHNRLRLSNCQDLAKQEFLEFEQIINKLFDIK